MKQLTCEMCGGTELIKQDGVFVCQNCGMKYSVEEAKKMMIEGTVDVSGSTIKVDNSKSIANFMLLAEVAVEGKDSTSVIKYAEKILELDSDRCEGYLLMAKSAGWESSLKDPKLDKALAYAKRAVALADDKGNVALDIYKSLKAQIFALLKNATDLPTNSGPYIAGLMCEWVKIISSIPSLPINTIKSEYNEIKRLSTCKKTLPSTNAFEDRLPCFVTTGVVLYNNKLAYHNMLVQNLDDYIVKQCGFKSDSVQNNTENTNKNKEQRSDKKGGCYVATSVYGSYDCPEVWTLRRYRDYTLAKTWYGRTFIKTYYAISPTIVKWFGHTEWFKKMWKGKLDRMIADLQADGVESTPYYD
ncbi:MAG: hypothetical protein IJZ35_07600 [Clostridia bacterium]|nr:hypothetical protein [Clostridia bacterium]